MNEIDPKDTTSPPEGAAVPTQQEGASSLPSEGESLPLAKSSSVSPLHRMPFSTVLLHKMIRSVLRRDQRPPRKDALAKLTVKLNETWIFVHYWKTSWCRTEQSRENAGQSITALLHALPDLQDAQRKHVTACGVIPALADGLAQAKRELKALDDLAAAAKTVWDIPTVPLRPIERWHDFADDVADVFREAMLSTNPNLVLGVANNGPVVRFVHTVIPFIIGQTPSMDAVAQQLKRSQRACRCKNGRRDYTQTRDKPEA